MAGVRPETVQYVDYFGLHGDGETTGDRRAPGSDGGFGDPSAKRNGIRPIWSTAASPAAAPVAAAEIGVRLWNAAPKRDAPQAILEPLCPMAVMTA